MNIAEWLWRQGRLKPSAPAVFVGTELLHDYGTLSHRALSLARVLVARGVKVGDRVAIWMENDPAYLELLFAIWSAGAVAVPLNHKLHTIEVHDICRSCGAALLFTGDETEKIGTVPTLSVFSDVYAQAASDEPLDRPARRRDDDLAWLFYTSGTTGPPKGAMLSFGNLSAMAHAYLTDVDQTAGEKAMIYAAPMSHGAGMYALPQTLIGGAHVIPKSRGFEPSEILKLAASEMLPPLSFFAAPTMVKRLVKAVEAAGSGADGIGLIVYGGGPMYAADIEAAVSIIGDRFAQIYGQGEAPMTITHLPRQVIADRDHPFWLGRLASVGVPNSCAEVKVIGFDGSEASPGTPGEILVAGPMVMQGYWRDPEATQAAVVDGWLRTGDIGVLDADGFLTLTDRSKDVIISGGSNIYPREVEEVLLRHADVEQVAVIGVPDPDWGEAVVAFVVAKGILEGSASDLDYHCLNAMARFKRPKAYVYVTDLPKNAYGKVMKTALREHYHSGVTGSSVLSEPPETRHSEGATPIKATVHNA